MSGFFFFLQKPSAKYFPAFAPDIKDNRLRNKTTGRRFGYYKERLFDIFGENYRRDNILN